jgi:hypothetical protein
MTVAMQASYVMNGFAESFLTALRLIQIFLIGFAKRIPTLLMLHLPLNVSNHRVAHE